MSEQGLTKLSKYWAQQKNIVPHAHYVHSQIVPMELREVYLAADVDAMLAQQRAELEQVKQERDQEYRHFRAALDEALEYKQQLAASQARCAQLEKALKTIADYAGENGCCPYGCDTPYIAKLALTERPPA
mgnify:CR=1 FL=1